MSDINFRILDYNYIFQTNIDITATSENASFPASNLAKEIRAKSWRSSGNFEITSTNKYIDFKESGGGAELNATLTEGSYTSTTLATEIKTQLESAGAETYTISLSSTTGKWTISHAGSYLSLLFSTGTNVANSINSTIGFSVSDYTGATTYTSSFLAIHTNEAVVFDLKSIEDIDSFALFFDPTDKINLSSMATITLQANATDIWTSPAVSVSLSYDNDFDVISYFFSTAQSYRYWRINIVDPQNTDLYVELGTAFLSYGTQLDTIPSRGFIFERNDMSKSQKNEYGNEYIDEYPILSSVTFKYSILDYDDIKTLDGVYKRVGRSKPIVVCLDNQEVLFDKDHFLIYGRMARRFRQSHMVRDYFNSELKITETA